MKIFITGANGFIGKNFCEYYQNETVYPYYRGDLAAELADFAPDVILNSAAEIYQSHLMWDSNVLLTRQCLEYVRQNPKTAMIQIGSSSEYGSVDRATCELDPIRPSDMYQATKGISTLLCQGYAHTYQLDVVIIRPYSVYGKHEKPHRLFPRLWRAFMLQEPMTLYQGWHDFIYIVDFMNGVNRILGASNRRRGDIVNLGTGRQFSNFDVADAFEKVLGSTAPITRVDKLNKQFESTTWVCDVGYAQEEYGVRCEFDLHEGIRHFIDSASYEE
jgi:UDP-glucuronate 4-epimerase